MPPWLLLWHDRRLQSAVIAFISVYLPIFFFGSYGYLPVILIIISTALLSYFAFGSQYLPYTSQAWILGLISSLSMAISATGSAQTVILCRYIHTFTLFHFTEFFFTGITNNENLKVDSFLLNHSLEYWVAAILSWFEFGIESLIAPWLVNSYISYLGTCVYLTFSCCFRSFHLYFGRIHPKTSHVSGQQCLYPSNCLQETEESLSRD